MKVNQIKNLISKIKTGPSKWELDEIVYYDRGTNPQTMAKFLNRIQELNSKSKNLEQDEKQELDYLLELLEEIDESEVEELINRTEEEAKNSFIEDLARKSAIEVLTNGKLGYDTMTTACKLSPNDFILCAKRTQDLITAIQGLVIKGETLSEDVAGA